MGCETVGGRTRLLWGLSPLLTQRERDSCGRALNAPTFPALPGSTQNWFLPQARLDGAQKRCRTRSEAQTEEGESPRAGLKPQGNADQMSCGGGVCVCWGGVHRTACHMFAVCGSVSCASFPPWALPSPQRPPSPPYSVPWPGLGRVIDPEDLRAQSQLVAGVRQESLHPPPTRASSPPLPVAVWRHLSVSAPLTSLGRKVLMSL